MTQTYRDHAELREMASREVITAAQRQAMIRANIGKHESDHEFEHYTVRELRRRAEWRRGIGWAPTRGTP